MTLSIALTNQTIGKTFARKDLHEFTILRHDWMPPFCAISECHSFFFFNEFGTTTLANFKITPTVVLKMIFHIVERLTTHVK